jgi:hemoglobin
MQFSEQKGHPALRDRHAGFAIGAQERDAWMKCMREALETVVADEALCKHIEERFYKLADFVRNDEGKST